MEKYQDLLVALEIKGIHSVTRVKVIYTRRDWCTWNYLGEWEGRRNCITSFGLILFTKHMCSTACGPWSERKRRK